MKKILTVLTLLVSLTAFSQSDSTSLDVITTENITQAEHIIDKYSSKVVDVFNSAVESATPLAEEGFKMVVRLQIAQGIVYLLPLILMFVFMFVFIKEYRRIESILDSDDEVPTHMNECYGPLEESNITPLLVGSSIFIILNAIMAMFFTFDGFTHLIAPEWYAIKEILSLV